MLIHAPRRWLPGTGAFAVWALAAASASYWGLKYSAAPGGPPQMPVAAVTAVAADPAAVARFLGTGPSAAPAAAPALASRFSLVGVVAGKTSGAGAALIGIDGKPPKPFRVGTKVEEGLVLQSVAPRRAVLGAERSGPATVTLEIPLRK